MKEKILITGGAGYLGSVLTGYLLEKGYQVTCLDNLMYRQNSLFSFSASKKFNFIYGDCRNKNLLEDTTPKFDIIIPLAAIVGAPPCDSKPQEARSINLDAIIMLNKIRSNSQMLIYPNTNSGYGTKSGEVFCTEKTPLEPISLYGKTKCKAEKHLLEDGKDVISLRLATVFGTSPRMRTNLLVNSLVLKAMREGYVVIYEKDSKRNYIHIKDVARAFEHCIKNYPSMKNESYNLGLENANLSKEELVLKIKEYIPKVEIIFMPVGEDPDKRNYIVSNKKIMSKGFHAKFSLDDGIEELIKGYTFMLKNDPYKNS